MKIKTRINIWFWMAVVIGCLPMITVAVMYDQKPQSAEVKHAKKVAKYLERYDCQKVNKAINTIEGLYECSDGFITFKEIEVFVWQEMQK